MATTDTGFTPRYDLGGNSTGIRRSYIIKNSATITVGDMIQASTGFMALAGAGGRILGCVIGLEDANHLDLDNAQATTGTGTWTSSTKTFIAASDNQTVDQVRAIVDVDPNTVYSGQPDAAIGTTTGSNLIGYYTDLPAASDQPDENTAVTTTAQLFIWGTDPENTARGLYSIAEHQIYGDF